jgi:ABC-type nitrate/sulfonate/bicarbonate transport system ATPase subunit
MPSRRYFAARGGAQRMTASRTARLLGSVIDRSAGAARRPLRQRPAVGEAQLQLRGVSKRYRRNWAVRSFDLYCRAGEVVSILGPSGCGKSTTLNLIAGLITPDEGAVLSSADRIGYVFQEPRLIPWRTALDNLLYVLDGAEPAAERQRAVEMLTQLQLGDSLNAYPRQLSGGMRQRVSIGRAFVHQPQLLLLDEPFSALDIALKQGLQQALIGLIDQHGPAVIHVTHDPLEAATLADRVIVCRQTVNEVATELHLNLPRGSRSAEFIEHEASRIKLTLAGRTI